MGNLLRALRSKWDFYLAAALSFAAIGVNLGPGFFFLAAYISGCAYITLLALRR